ncbi:MAG: hypothetical protein J2P16_05840, partial [Mycobacterium sp.]|nr:hypothetical protein [Mycobacterium sp.]
PVSPRMVFENPTVQQLADALETAGASGASADAEADRHHAPMSTSGLSADDLAAVTQSWGGGKS